MLEDFLFYYISKHFWRCSVCTCSVITFNQFLLLWTAEIIFSSLQQWTGTQCSFDSNFLLFGISGVEKSRKILSNGRKAVSTQISQVAPAACVKWGNPSCVTLRPNREQSAAAG